MAAPREEIGQSRLPEEVMDRLSVAGNVRVRALGAPDGEAAEGGPTVASAAATAAPLNGVLYVLVSAGGALERALLEHVAVEVVGEGTDARGPWHIRVTGRGLAGRAVTADPRRSELLHWVPEGVLPQHLLAVRIIPEELEYSWVSPAGRQRAAGPIPGADPPALAGRWARMAIHGTVFWLPVIGAITWGGMLFWVPPPLRNLLLLAMVLGTAAALYAGVGWLGRCAAFWSWRGGHLREEQVGDWLMAWEAPRQVQRSGVAALGGGLAFLILLALVGGRELAGTAFLASGAWLFGPIHATRYLFRQTDAEST